MRGPTLSVLTLGVLALVATGCAHFKPQSSGANTPDGKHLTVAMKLPRQTLKFKPTRDDITVGCAILSLYQADMGMALNLDAVRVNGVRPKSDRLYLKRAGTNQFELPALKIEFSSEEVGGPLYVALKVWFNELTNQEDSPYYESAHVADRYALLSYCTKEDDDPTQVNARMGANRVKTVAEFKERLAQPLVIRLNQQPLRPGLGHWPMINNQRQLRATLIPRRKFCRREVIHRRLRGGITNLPHRRLNNFGAHISDTDLKTIEQLVRDRGERHLIAISANGRDRAIVGVGDHDHYEDTRRYDLTRTDGTWRIEKVEPRESGW
jgi:hypothetical protein